MTKIRLSDMQLVLLATAAQRDDGSLMPLPDSLGDQAERARKAVTALIRKGLTEEKPGVSKAAAWREEGDTFVGVVITEAGRAAIGGMDQAEARDVPSTASNAKPMTKRAQLTALLERADGASLDEMVAATGWLPHTTRAALTGLRKKGLALSSDKVDGVRRYRIVR